MEFGDVDIGCRGVGADNFAAEPGQRLAEETATAADIEYAKAGEDAGSLGIAAETATDFLANEAEPDRVDLM